MFGCSLMEMWTMDICEGRSWSLYVPQSPVSWIVTGTCTHLMERGYLLLHFHDYLLSCVFAAIWQILRGGSHRLQSNQLKTRKIFLPQRGIEPRTFQSWVFCLAIWAITPLPPGVDFINPFTLYAKLLRSAPNFWEAFLRRKSSAQSVKAWRRA